MKKPVLVLAALAAVAGPSELFAQAPPAEPAPGVVAAPAGRVPAKANVTPETASAPPALPQSPAAAPSPGTAASDRAPAQPALAAPAASPPERDLGQAEAEAASASPAEPAAPITAEVTTAPAGPAPAPGRAPKHFDSPSDSAPDVAEERAAPDTPTFDAWAGASSTIVTSPGLDPFSENDVVPHFSTGLGWSFGAAGGARWAAVAVLDVGGSSAEVRGEDSDLSVLRLGLGPELRLPLLGRLYAYGRINPAAVSISTEVHEASSGVPLTAQQWTVGLDSVLGLALRFADARPNGLAGPIGFFLRFEAGYSWTPAEEVRLGSEDSAAPVRTSPLGLEDLALGGLALRGAFGIGY